MKTCVHCVGHVDGAKCKKRVCPGTFACQVLAKNGVKLIKVSVKVTKTPVPPAGATASVVPPVPPIPEDVVAAPEALTGLEVWRQGWRQLFLVRVQATVTSPLEQFIY